MHVEISLTPQFRAAFPAGVFGALVARQCPNRPRSERLADVKRAVEDRLRLRFPGEMIDADPVARGYAAYFRRHGARYPVVHQAKTILTGRRIESPSAIVEAMFTAEVDSLILTSGHDLDALQGPLSVDVARDGETYTRINGKAQTLRPGDMVVRDSAGIIACVLYGPDQRTRLRPDSGAALFGAWCPVDVAPAVVDAHLAALARLLRREWPEATVDPPRLWTAADEGTPGVR